MLSHWEFVPVTTEIPGKLNAVYSTQPPNPCQQVTSLNFCPQTISKGAALGWVLCGNYLRSRYQQSYQIGCFWRSLVECAAQVFPSSHWQSLHPRLFLTVTGRICSQENLNDLFSNTRSDFQAKSNSTARLQILNPTLIMITTDN